MKKYFYNKYSINILASIIALLIVFIFSNIINNISNRAIKLNQENINEVENEINYNDLVFAKDEMNNIEESLNIIESSEKWYLEIEKIDLIAEIKDGTDEEILDYYIGHFLNTPVKIGNVGLAAHNRGYKNNYFSRLKELEKGDKINYYINGNKIIYEVIDKVIIYETDWSYLENTNDNRLTLITCIENREKYRLCVQAVRVKEE